jgi:Asp-tRNA(Asn)/Glu-tRNA(Gln) amidotransferase A subunit family amidase
MEKRTYYQTYPATRWTTRVTVPIAMTEYDSLESVQRAIEAAAAEMEAAGLSRDEVRFDVDLATEYGDRYTTFSLEGERTATAAERKQAQAAEETLKRERLRAAQADVERLRRELDERVALLGDL